MIFSINSKFTSAFTYWSYKFNCTFHFGWTIHGAGLNKSDKIREAMVVTYYADGSRVGKLDTKDRKGDAELFLGGKKAGEIADHPMNKIVYQR